jgi:L-serine deaminase
MYQIKFLELEITQILLSDVYKIIKNADLCKVNNLGIICTEGYMNSLEKIEKVFIAVSKSKTLKKMNLKITYQRNKFEIEEMIDYSKK